MERRPNGLETSWSDEEIAIEPWRREWRSLAAQLAAPLPDSPEFLEPWLDCRTVQHRRLLGIRERGALVALSPWIWQSRRRHGVPLRVMSVPAGSSGTLGTLIRPPIDRAAAPAAILLRALAEATLDAEGWDLIELGPLRQAAPLETAFLHAATARGLAVRFYSTNSRVRLDLSAGWERLLERASTGRRRRLMSLPHALERAGLRILEARDGDQVEQLLEAAFLIATKSRIGRAGRSMACHVESRRFYARLTQRLAARGRLALFVLAREQRPLAFLYHALERGVAWQLQSGARDDDASFDLLPTLLGEVVRRQIPRGVKSIELVHGGPDDWSGFGVDHAPGRMLEIFARSARAAASHVVTRLARRGVTTTI